MEENINYITIQNQTLSELQEKIKNYTDSKGKKISDLSTLFRTVVHAHCCISSYFTGDR
ncbi:MAG TPA: hypothetical protein LFW10_03245 [Rickettsia endosymbiont of Diachasma alloeum]|nr:hypothetical protein [Rickettsia endosymbiont of Diachasma alloeum]